MAVLLNHELHEPGGEITDEVCDRLLAAEETTQKGRGEADIEMLRGRMFRRLTQSMIDSAVERFRSGVGRGILLWCEDASVHFIPEAQLTVALSLDSAVRGDIFLILGQYTFDSEAVVLTSRHDEIELLHLGPGYAKRSWGTHSLQH